MKVHPFDDRLKKRLQNYESAVPADMWQRIVQEKKRRRFILLPRQYSLLTLLLLSIAGSFIYFNTTDPIKYVTSTGSKPHKPGALKIIKKQANNNKNLLVTPYPITNNKSTGLIESSIHYAVSRFKKEKHKTIHHKQNELATREPGSTTRNEFNYNNEEDSITGKIDLPAKKQPVPDSTDDNVALKPKEEDDYRDKFSIELYASPVAAFGDFKDNDPQYQRILQQAAALKISYALGANITIQITKNISAKTGVRYLQVNEDMSIPYSVLSGNTVIKNKYKNIGVPLQFSFNVVRSKSLFAALNAGIILNISSKYKGALPLISGDQLDLDKDIVYKKNANVMAHFGIDLTKQIKKHTDIFAEPWFEYRVKNMVNDNYTFTRKLHNTGLSLGLRYRLYKASQ